jgi:hypothetical protein
MMHEDYYEHMNFSITEEIEKYATEIALKESRYLFTRRERKHQYAYCTHCHVEYESFGLRHSELEQCPKCKSYCTVKASGRSRKYMFDEGYFTYYEKSVKDPTVITAKGIHAFRDYRGDYKNIKTKYWIEAVYIFQMGDSRMFKSDYFRRDSFYKCSSVHSLINYLENKTYIKSTCYSRESISNVVEGTPFQYSTWEQYSDDDMVRFFSLYSKYPCIEQLTKVDCNEIVESKLYGNKTYSAINWRGKTIFKILRITKKDLKEIRATNVSITPLFLRLYQISKKDKSNLAIAELKSIERSYGLYFSELQSMLQYASLKKVNDYIKRQYDNKGKKSRYYSQHYVLTDWKDYIADCIKLGMNVSKESVLFPKNLHSAHQNTIKQIKLKADEELNKKIKQRITDVNKQYAFKFGGLLIRAAESSNELIAEGEALSHCVGTYTDRYARGETNILVIRKETEADKPFYTMEIRNNEIIQVRGKRNCKPTENVEALIEAFKDVKLQKKKDKIKIPA